MLVVYFHTYHHIIVVLRLTQHQMTKHNNGGLYCEERIKSVFKVCSYAYHIIHSTYSINDMVFTTTTSSAPLPSLRSSILSWSLLPTVYETITLSICCVHKRCG